MTDYFVYKVINFQQILKIIDIILKLFYLWMICGQTDCFCEITLSIWVLLILLLLSKSYKVFKEVYDHY